VRVSLLREGGLGEPELSKIRWVKDSLQARVVFKHAGRDLGSSEEVLRGSVLRKALATLCVERRWKPEILDRLIEEEFYRKLAADLDGVETPSRAPVDVIEERLCALGVEECGDLELLENEDFFEIDLDSYQFEKLRSDYPRLYRFSGITFEMEYQPKKRRVIMNSLSQVKGVKVKPQHIPGWNGWRVELVERGRATVVR